ncbi:MAG TPA: hypothetical protein PLG23_06835, partial [Thermoflexales bacterium]|nr:hypothetical protein [Thermoflexales bacterium]HQZ53162.1 hypothetical protein [Thermoflexales bacterium]
MMMVKVMYFTSLAAVLKPIGEIAIPALQAGIAISPIGFRMTSSVMSLRSCRQSMTLEQSRLG